MNQEATSPFLFPPASALPKPIYWQAGTQSEFASLTLIVFTVWTCGGGKCDRKWWMPRFDPWGRVTMFIALFCRLDVPPGAGGPPAPPHRQGLHRPAPQQLLLLQEQEASEGSGEATEAVGGAPEPVYRHGEESTLR